MINSVANLNNYALAPPGKTASDSSQNLNAVIRRNSTENFYPLSVTPSIKDSQIQVNSKDSQFWRTLKWLKNHIDLVQATVIIFLIGNLISVPIAHLSRLAQYKDFHGIPHPFSGLTSRFQETGPEHKPTMFSVYHGLKNDIAYLVLGLLTYSIPVLAFDSIGQKWAEQKVLKDSEDQNLYASPIQLKSLASYLGALLGLIWGMLMNDILKQSVRPPVESKIDNLLFNSPKLLEKFGFNKETLLTERKAVRSVEKSH